MNTFEEGLRKDTLGFLRGSIFFRNRIVTYHHVKISKVTGTLREEGFSFSHSSLIVDKFYFFLKNTPTGLVFECENLDNVEVITSKDVGISMFEGTEIEFAGNYILRHLKDSPTVKTVDQVLRLLLLTICDSLEEINVDDLIGKDFIYQRLRVAKSMIPSVRFCQIL